MQGCGTPLCQFVWTAVCSCFALPAFVDPCMLLLEPYVSRQRYAGNVCKD